MKLHNIRTLSSEDKVNLLRLARTKGMSRSAIVKLVDIFGNIDDAILNAAEYSIKGGLKDPINICPIDVALRELEDCENIGAEIIFICEESYPEMLRQISDPPISITVRGDQSLMHENIVAIVGPRNASINGCRFAQKIAFELGHREIVIASGLARGIDTAAHKSSVDTGTIAVIAGGIDNVYPKENSDLYKQIIEKGLLISENAIGTVPRGGNFPQRNRIISGLSLGVVVVEATLRSGTLITARCAMEQNRELFAIPGSPFDPRYEGTNRLIKQGAKLTESSSDILEDIESIIRSRISELQINDSLESDVKHATFKAPDDKLVSDVRKMILSKLNYTPISVDSLVNDLDIPVKIVNIAMVQLELADKVEHKNGTVFLKSSYKNTHI